MSYCRLPHDVVPNAVPTGCRGWIVLIVILGVGVPATLAGGTPIDQTLTYQGRLTDGGSPANASLDMVFTLWDAEVGGIPVGLPSVELGVLVIDGLFTVELDFDPDVFNGKQRWLEIMVDTTTLSPRQPITVAPYAAALPALRTTPGTATGLADHPNVLGGHCDNTVGPMVSGAVVAGGGQAAPNANSVTANYGTVSGGLGNNASAESATVSGGTGNAASSPGATIGGGRQHTTSAQDGTIAGGFQNTAGGAFLSTIGGGQLNTATGDSSTIAGGDSNTASAERSSIGGGFQNAAGGQFATVPGGHSNAATGDYSFAAGRRAKANHNGSFVWADANNADFISSAANQFIIRADGGVGLGTNNPERALHISNSDGVIRVDRDAADPGLLIVRTASGDLSTIWKTFAVETRATAVDSGSFAITDLGTAVSGGGNERLVIDNNGNMGVGTSASTARLQVKHSGTITAIRGTHDDVSGITYGVLGETASTSGYAIRGEAGAASGVTFGVYGTHTSPNGWAVWGNGRIGASGTKSFVIDHPLDPANKYLVHYSSEGPVPQNTYNGVVTLNNAGEAWVTLPDYFQSINTDFRYQLTPIGGPAAVYIADEIRGNTFRIAGGTPGLTVSWEVKGQRNDAFVQQRGAAVVSDKAEMHRGLYLMPELYGQPAEKGIHYQAAPLNDPPGAH